MDGVEHAVWNRDNTHADVRVVDLVVGPGTLETVFPGVPNELLDAKRWLARESGEQSVTPGVGFYRFGVGGVKNGDLIAQDVGRGLLPILLKGF